MNGKQKNVTVAGTDIDEVKRLNSQSGLSYNQVKKMLAEKYLENKK
jgi:predicted DNA binding CopG/RHH family protein